LTTPQGVCHEPLHFNLKMWEKSAHAWGPDGLENGKSAGLIGLARLIISGWAGSVAGILAAAVSQFHLSESLVSLTL